MTDGLKFESRVVAFIDILGFGELVENAAANPEGAASKHLRRALTVIGNLQLLEPSHYDHASSTEKNQFKNAALRLQLFSDSIIISVSPNQESVRVLLIELCRLFLLLMREGVWMRGGVSEGLLSDSPSAPCGPAMNNAYNTESQIAKTPRIALSSTFIKFCIENKCENLIEELAERHEDGVYALSPISSAINMPEELRLKLQEMASEIQSHLQTSLSEIVDKPSVFEKVKSLADEWDLAVDPKKSGFSDDFRTGYFTDFADQMSNFMQDLPDA